MFVAESLLSYFELASSKISTASSRFWKKSAQERCLAAQIRSSLTFPVTWALVANMAPTIFLRLRQYVHHMYLGGHTKAQGKQMFGCRTIAAELPEILPE